MRYYSIDLETTGLDPVNYEIIEMGVVADLDQAMPFDELPRLRIVVVKSRYYVSPRIMDFHKNLWSEIKNHQDIKFENNTHYVRTPIEFQTVFADWLRHYEPDPIIITPAGKNFAGFDRPFLDKLGMRSISFHHRSLDPGSMYARPTDLMVPDTKTCCARAGFELDPIFNHTAVYDAEVVVRLIRNHWNET